MTGFPGIAFDIRFRNENVAHLFERQFACCAAIRARNRIASPGMLLKTEPLPHLICSRRVFIDGVWDEAGQHGDT
jgi:hypothetical protein